MLLFSEFLSRSWIRSPTPIILLHRAQIEKDGQSSDITLTLFDNGSGADRIANDGIYSRYFARYDNGEGRYLVKCQVSNTDDSEINGGFINGRNWLSSAKAYPIGSPLTPPCCGSTTVSGSTSSTPTGNFTRKASGGAIKLLNVPSSDTIAPSQILDLTLTRNVTSRSLVIAFTSPGDDYDQGTGEKVIEPFDTKNELGITS